VPAVESGEGSECDQGRIDAGNVGSRVVTGPPRSPDHRRRDEGGDEDAERHHQGTAEPSGDHGPNSS
jgi:hypothetical protein